MIEIARQLPGHHPVCFPEGTVVTQTPKDVLPTMSKRPRRSSEKVVYDLKQVKVIGEPFQTKKKLSMLLFSFALSVAVLAQTDSDEEPDYQSRLC